jgi:tRNA A22 N-methylase
LSARLETVRLLCARPLPTASDGSASRFHVVADIACDHCTLSIALLKSGVAQRVIAVDVCASPLATGRAKATRLLAPALRTCLELRLGDGLGPLTLADGVGTVCVVGVGAYSVLQILDPAAPEIPQGMNADRLTGRLVSPALKNSSAAGPIVTACAARALGVQRLVLQPVDSRPHQMAPLRRWLRASGWRIADETLCGGGTKPLYLTLLAERESGFLDNNNGDGGWRSNEPDDAAYVEDLVLPRTLRQRVHRALRARVAQPPGVTDTEATAGVDDEVSLWQAYVQLHRDWIAVARFDAYDKTGGLPPGAIAAALAAECDALRVHGVDL